MSPEETFRRVLAARLPAGPGWTAWIDGTAAELAGSVPEWRVDRDRVQLLVEEAVEQGERAYRGFRKEPPDLVGLTDALIALLQPAAAP